MSVTYTVTEPDGHQHTRTSRGEFRARYTHAVVLVPHGEKHQVSYHGNEAAARARLAGALQQTYQGRRSYPDAAMYPAEAVVKLKLTAEA